MLVNGEQADTISVQDRGLLYGDGIFETILCQQGEPLLLDLHLQRLQRGCQALHLTQPAETVLKQEITSVAEGQDCVIKIIITRGVRARGYRFDQHDATSQRIVYASPCPEIPAAYYQQGIKLGVSDFRLANNPQLAGIKHLNRLEQVMACHPWPDDCAEVLTLDQHGHVIEGTMTNLFADIDGICCTPALDQAGINGVMREWLIQQLAELTINCQIKPLTLTDLKRASSLFVCNSVMGIWPVHTLQQQSYGCSAVTEKLMHHLNQHLSARFLTFENA